MCAKLLQSCLTFCNSMDCSPSGSSVHRDSPGKNTEMGCGPSSKGIFPIQGSKPTSYIFSTGRWILDHKCHLGSQWWMVNIWK